MMGWKCYKCKSPTSISMVLCEKCIMDNKIEQCCYMFFTHLSNVGRRVQWKIDAGDAILYEGKDEYEQQVVDMACKLCQTPIRLLDMNLSYSSNYIPGQAYKMSCPINGKEQPCVNVRKYPKIVKDEYDLHIPDKKMCRMMGWESWD